jgi:L-fuconolactonase
MFGSDWPVCLLAGGYDQVLGAAQTLVRTCLGPGAEKGIFGGNAARFYRLDDSAAGSH